jgi:nucleotide-binding universal stress UspA family protein
MRTPIRELLVGSSLAPASDTVVAAGRDLARALGARLRLVHAFSPAMIFIGRPVPHAGLETRAVAEQEAALRRELEQQAARLGLGRDELAGCEVVAGPAHRALRELATRHESDLVVVGAAERPGARLLGSTADRLVRTATRPVWVVRGESAIPPRRILFPLDLSPLAGDALRCGLALAERLRAPVRADLGALYVLTLPLGPTPVPFVPEQLAHLAEEELERFLSRFEGRGELAAKVRTGEARHEIRAEAREWGADLIVLGTHGRGGFERYLMGSVAGDVVRAADCDVLVVPPEAALRAALDENRSTAQVGVGPPPG